MRQHHRQWWVRRAASTGASRPAWRGPYLGVYLKSLASNTRAMVDGVTAGAVTCTLPS